MSRPITIALLALAICPHLQAANFYKHVDADGIVTYGNQQPGAAPATPPQGQARAAAPLYGAIEPSASQSRQLRARLQQDIAQQLLQRHLPAISPDSTAASGYRYVRPWKADQYAVSQGFHGSFSHNTPQSRHALDIAMPEGTAIHAARSGTVLKVKNDVQGRGSNPNGNYLRILHSDGTSSAYLHLQQGSVVVNEGQRVETGQYLGRSGNTGRSTGPHLHFVVQRHVNGRFESIPFVFENPPSALQNLATSTD